MKLSKSLFVLPLLLAASITSCVDTGYYGGPRPSNGGASVSVSRGYYTTLPRNYAGDAYFYNGRYYDGGNYQTGVYSYQGRTYNNRYYQNGQYLYGGVHQHHGHPGSSQTQGRPDYRGSQGYPSRTDSRYAHPSMNRHP